MARILLAKARRATLEQLSVVPPLGILYLAAVLQRDGHEVRVFDMRPDDVGSTRFVSTLNSFRPDIVGLSAITFEASVLAQLAATARAVLPSAPLVVGGAHATAYPELCLNLQGVDYVVVGEGEETLSALVKSLLGEQSVHPAEIPGVVAHGSCGGAVTRASARVPAVDLDDLPLPAWDLIDLEMYREFKGMAPLGRRRYMPVVTSRGCPYRCVYCHQVHGKRYRARSPRNVVDEIQTVHERYGIREFEIIDDTFNLDRERMRDILAQLAALPWRPVLAFPNGVRSDLLDEELIAEMVAAGTRYMAVAIESGSPRLQELIRKNLDLARARENIGHAVRAGMFVNGFFMLGFPTETLGEAQQTVRFALDSELHSAMFFTVMPYAGTELFERWNDLVRARGLGDEFDSSDYWFARCNISEMSDEELFGLQRAAWRRFYLDPRRLARILKSHPNKGYLVKEGLITLRKMLPR